MICGLLLAAACPKQDEAELAARLDARSVQGREGDERPAPKVHTQDHFTVAEEIRLALISGNVDAALAPAAWMAEHYAELEYPEPWRPYVEHMHDSADKIGSGVELAVASAALVEVGQACAACHVAVDGPEIEVDEPPSADAAGDTGDTDVVTVDHGWAIDTMWTGLTGPSRTAWITGAEALAVAPLVPEEIRGGRSARAEIEELAMRVHEIGDQARQSLVVSGIPGQLFGELLTTCEACHAALDRH
ncbi:hypothetical protein ENSA5_04900 [Enhygromyxa salina]|uniref:Uncharacterized protein n=1 Tax=Enhygromyxa salina TaxID=215803 RepID=A0A2S9YHY4_9BACT|nr:hypothetical protein ENSA5_04900 [Enhygromyxa salina]